MNVDPDKIADLITEAIDEVAPTGGQGPMEPKQFIDAINGVIASAPHGRQGEVLARVAALGQENLQQMITMLQGVEPATDLSYVQDFYRSKGSNIMAIAKVAQMVYDENTVMQILDMIDLTSDYGDPDDEEDDLYNGEGDGYSH